MKLSEIVSAASGLAVYAEVALVLFLAAFAAIVTQVFSKQNRSEWKEAETMPLLDGSDDVVAKITKAELP